MKKVKTMFVSIIIPVLNEEAFIKQLLQQLQGYRKQGHEVIVVDGGSIDHTVLISSELSDKVIKSEAGRAVQMNNGASQSKNAVLWFLHADTLIPEKAVENIQAALNKSDWGRFNIKLSGTNGLFRLIEFMMNMRSYFTGIATGDQGIFVKRKSFESVGRYSNLPLMEDINLSKKLIKISKPACIKNTLITSSRRWEEKGILSTVFLMWRLRFLYWLGVSANKLATRYK